MQLTTPRSAATLSESFATLLQTEPQPATSSTQRPKLKMVWHKEFDGKRERMVAQWTMEP